MKNNQKLYIPNFTGDRLQNAWWYFQLFTYILEIKKFSILLLFLDIEATKGICSPFL